MDSKKTKEMMMWFDNDKEKSNEQKIEEGIDYCKNKYEVVPDVVFVSPEILKDFNYNKFEKFSIIGDTLISKNYFFITNSTKGLLDKR